MLSIDTIPGRTVNIDGIEHLYFSGTSYLGMGRNPEFTELLIQGLRRYGNNYSSSRISNLQIKVFEEAEIFLSKTFGSEAALTMSSGYMAAQVVVQMLLAQPQTTFVYAPKTHPALWRSPADFFIEDFQVWIDSLFDSIKTNSPGKIAILCNSIDPLLAEKYSFDWIQDLPSEKEFTVVIDDSHGFGVTGKNGKGIISEIEVPDHVTLIITGSLGKALGVPGGVIFSTQGIIEQLKSSAFFGGSSPALPAYLFAFIEAGEIYEKARQKLSENIEFFLQNLPDKEGLKFFSNYPVFYIKDNNWEKKLLKKNIMISSFPYPTSNDALVSRIILNSLHTRADIEILISAMKDTYE